MATKDIVLSYHPKHGEISEGNCTGGTKGDNNHESIIDLDAWKHSNFLCKNIILSGLDNTLYEVYSSKNSAQNGVKCVATAGNPSIEDAAELPRMCVRCGIPKTYSHSRGIVCPVCGDRPPMDTDEPDKKKESTIKDKEKSKRMKGQSSHATWKSEDRNATSTTV